MTNQTKKEVLKKTKKNILYDLSSQILEWVKKIILYFLFIKTAV